MNSSQKKIMKIMFFTVVLIILSFMIYAGNKPEYNFTNIDEVRKIEFTILAVNDIHSHIFPMKLVENGEIITTGGLGMAETLIRNEINKTPDKVIFLFEGGDVVIGVSTKFLSDSPEFEILSKSGFDAGVLGNHEFDGNTEDLKAMPFEKLFPILASNLTFEDPILEKAFPKTVIIEKNGIKLGLFGFVPPDLNTIVKDLAGVKVSTDIESLASQYVNELKNKGVDAIIAINHIGLSDDINLAAKISGIHVIVGGHSHDTVPQKTIVKSPDGWETMIGQSGYYARWVGRYDISIVNGVLDSGNSSWNVLEVNGVISIDKHVEELANKQLDIIAGDVGLKNSFVFELMETLDVSSNLMRSQENALGNMVAEAFRYVTKAQIGFANGGGIRLYRVQPAGEITVAEMLEMMPFGGKTFKIFATGAEIRRQMEGSAVAGEKRHGDFLQVAGLRVKFDMESTPAVLDNIGRPTGGSRVAELQLETDNGFVPLEDDKVYTVAIPDYLEKRWEFTDKETLNPGEDKDILIVDKYCEEVLDRKFYPKTDNRISFIK